MRVDCEACGARNPIGADGTVDISPSARFCTGAQIMTKLYDGIDSLVKAEARHHRPRSGKSLRCEAA